MMIKEKKYYPTIAFKTTEEKKQRLSFMAKKEGRTLSNFIKLIIDKFLMKGGELK